MSILILSYSIDPHVSAVKKSLDEKGGEYIEYNFLQFPTQSQIGLELNGTSCNAHLKINNQIFDLQDFTAVWYRRPMEPKTFPKAKPYIRKYVEKECEIFLSNLSCLFPQALLVSDPNKNRIADNKILQLQLASRLGFNIPHTVMGNDPEKAKKLFILYPEILTKAFYLAYISVDLGLIGRVKKRLWNFFNSERLKELYYSNFSYSEGIELLAKKLKSTESEYFLPSVPNCPITLQNYIPKQLELRITVVGQQIFPCAIYSQEQAAGSIDWRSNEDTMRHEAYQLPQDIEQKCFALVKELGLEFGCIDMILTPDGEYVFLEINSNGQWYWIQEKTGLPIADAIADLLITRNSLQSPLQPKECQVASR